MSNDQTTTPIPVSAGQRIAEEFGYDQVVIVARKVGVTEHVTTYGVDKANCAVAARMGSFFKHKLMEWPVPAPRDTVAMLAQHASLVQELALASQVRGMDLGHGSDNADSRALEEAALSAVLASARKLLLEA